MSEALHGWDTFYVIVGSSGAALTGLMFVVITLTTQSRTASGPGGLDAFATPTVVHFCVVLLIAVILTSPRHTETSLSFGVAIVGLAGLVYSGIVLIRIRKLGSGYAPVGEDWLFHCWFPLIAYGGLIAAAVAIWRGSVTALYVVAASALLLLYTGIHNAWDTATWMAIQSKDDKGKLTICSDDQR